MALRGRLDTLRRQAGALPPTSAGAEAPAAAPPALARRLERLRPRSLPPHASPHAPAPAPTRPRIDDAELARRLGGRPLAPGLLLLERRLPLATPHGRLPLAALLHGPTALPEARDLAGHGLIFFDTETSGLSGGSGTVAFLLGLGRVAGRDFVVRQYLLTAFSGEAAMLRAAGEWLGGAAGLASFNGKSFDAPLLATRYRLHGLADPFAPLPHLDLLAPTRRAFGRRWPDCRLGSAERRLLGFRREDDLPGAEAPAAWLDFLRRNDPGRLAAVARHNHWDILSLAVLLPALARVHAEPAAWEADTEAVARALLKREREAEAFALLHGQAEALGEEGRLALARLHRRRGEWTAACALWEGLAAAGCVEAVEQLAKYHEHRRRDYRAALGYARRLPAVDGHQLRRERLQRKLEGNGGQGRMF